MRTKTLTALLVGTAMTTSVLVAGGPVAGAAAEGCADANRTITRDVDYVKKPVSELQRLDIYGFAGDEGCTAAPVVVWVHGGGWRLGDKRAVDEKARFFNDLGAVFVSVNYRLSAPPGDPNRPMYPDHPNDVGAAVAWTEANIAKHGGDGEQIALLGHSAGGHLVALVGLDPSYIDDAGGDAASVRCVIANDSEGYDVVTRTAQGGVVRRLYENAFGTDPAVQADASPINHTGDRAHPPAFLVITRGAQRRIDAAKAFADAVTSAGGDATVVEAPGYTHGDVNRRLGTKGETVVTPPIEDFFTDCFGRQ
jgi:arylformamidase